MGHNRRCQKAVSEWKGAWLRALYWQLRTSFAFPREKAQDTPRLLVTLKRKVYVYMHTHTHTYMYIYVAYIYNIYTVLEESFWKDIHI